MAARMHVGGRPEKIGLSPRDREICDAIGPLLRELVTRDPGTFFALNADREAPFGTVMSVLDGLKEAGVKGSLTAFMERSK